MDEAVMALLETFMEIERELGRKVFEDVVERARIAVAAEVMVEAERRAIRNRRTMVTQSHAPGVVIAFPGNPGHA
ncbi:hypothetical protein [Methylobacterium sp. Leaf106]|uniref:hypothetical protein n=1 Tax=Methylobacterium sp. Leaf106 TaxID=1736255 RepID=UPI0009EBFB5D|nr:hypothetical protein [Methylobacterium sp. Leaf106]